MDRKKIQEIKNSIANDKIEEAIGSFMQYAEDKNSSLYNDLVSLSMQFKRWSRKDRRKLTDSNLELRQIVDTLLELLNEEEKAEEKRQKQGVEKESKPPTLKKKGEKSKRMDKEKGQLEESHIAESESANDLEEQKKPLTIDKKKAFWRKPYLEKFWIGAISILLLIIIFGIQWSLDRRVPVQDGKLFGYKISEKKNHWIIEPQYDSVEEFKNGLAKVIRGDEDFYIDKEGDCEVGCPKLFRYRKNNLYGVKNENSKEITLAIYDDIGFHDGRFIGVMKYEKWGIVNEKGTEVIPLIYDEVVYLNRFQNGSSKIIMGNDTLLINEEGDRITPQDPKENSN